MNEAQELFELATHAIDKTAIITPRDIRRTMDAGLLTYAIGEGGYYYCPTEKYNEVWEEVNLGEDEATYKFAKCLIETQDLTAVIENPSLVVDHWVRIARNNDGSKKVASGVAYFVHKERMGYE